MTLQRAFLWAWIGGLVLFAVVIAISMPLVLTAVPNGIMDHQAAGTAAEVNRIQAAWSSAGLIDHAAIAMAGDLLFIGVYGAGCVMGGIWLRQHHDRRVRLLGTTALIAGITFLVTDYAETISQIVQLVRFSGDDTLAGVAAKVRPIKVAAWIAATLAIALALLIGRKSPSRT
ncbi:hypothetical protein [Qipengyuania zhejiangensis]|uniref:hypothetical protein n=1 Tax=Qipengyuania zhejiangensis TaxID=3077782 RepID=UPI002D778C7A|nr:hypothetical protein [Qipengyuania sp. Z2]